MGSNQVLGHFLPAVKMRQIHPFGAGYSGKTEGNGWDDETKETIGQPKPKKKPSEALSGGSSGGPATVEKTMGKAEAYKKQEKQMSERVAAMESVQASKKPWWRDRDLLMGGLELLMVAVLLVAIYKGDAIFDWIGQKIPEIL